MSQQTDSLPPGYDGRRTLRAFGLTLLLLAGIEIAFRALAPQLSGNLVHIRDFDRLLVAFDAAPGPRALFIGNSLTNNAVQQQHFAALAGAMSGRSVETLKLVPDGTTLWDWRCIIERLTPARAGDVLVIGYAWAQIADQQTMNISRTFGLLCPLTELPATARFQDLTVGQWIEAGVSRLSLVYVLRERISSAVLAGIVPHYEIQLQRINDRARDADDTSATAGSAQRTYASLKASLQRANDLGYRVVIVAMPTVRPYPVDPKLASTLEDIGVEYVDLRDEPWLQPSLFVDSIHLGPEGARQLTGVLAERVFGGTQPLAGM
jgi:hypothetical protein